VYCAAEYVCISQNVRHVREPREDAIDMCTAACKKLYYASCDICFLYESRTP
jgi:hypothetical protein